MSENPKGQTCANCKYYRDGIVSATNHLRNTGGITFPISNVMSSSSANYAFYSPSSDGTCVRMPSHELVVRHHYCGEWRPDKGLTPTSTAIALAEAVLARSGDRVVIGAMCDCIMESLWDWDELPVAEEITS